MKLLVSLLGRIDYKEALDIQKKLLSLRQEGRIEDTLLLLEHLPVLTIGKSGEHSNVLIPEQALKDEKVTVYEVERGGDVTYHGPGQIVGYPILDLNNHVKDIHYFIQRIEEVFIELLKDEYGITAGRDPKYIGVWVGDEKITAIGFNIKRWVTMHGFAFNVNTNLEHFKWINPCGITDKGVTSLKKILGHDMDMDMDMVMQQVIGHFCSIFNMEYEIIEKQHLYGLIGRDSNE